MLFSQIYLTDGLNQDFSLNDDTAETSSRYLYGFENREGGENLTLGVNICNFRSFNSQGAINSSPSQCSFWQTESSDKLSLEEGESAVVEVRSLHTDNPETASVPSYPSFKIHAVSGLAEEDDVFLYATPEMFATEEKLYAWTPYTSGVLTTSTSSSNAYNMTKVDVVNDNFITVGTGPLVDTTMVRAYKNEFGFFAGAGSSNLSMYQYADGSTEAKIGGNPNPTKAQVSLERNGSTVISTLLSNLDSHFSINFAGLQIPDAEGQLDGASYDGPVSGSYTATLDRVSKFNGEEQNGVSQVNSLSILVIH
jgi:hypothetical protein